MTNGTNTHLLKPTEPPARYRRRLILPVAAAATAVLLFAGAYALARDDAPASDDLASGSDAGGSSAPISPGGLSASCVAMYDLTTLVDREFAFDGTVRKVSGDELTLSVNEWFRGSGTPEVTLGGAEGLSGLTSAGDEVSIEPGARMLVSGDGGFAWTCGFTQPYDEAVASQWREALVR